MNQEIYRVEQALKNDANFSTIKNIEQFSELVHKIYWNRFDIVKEIQKASLWIMANPKRVKRNYARYLTNWLARKR